MGNKDRGRVNTEKQSIQVVWSVRSAINREDR